MTKIDKNQDEYFRGIEEYTARIRLSPMLLSPKEWTVASRWKADEIPLMVVFRGIDAAIRGVMSQKSDYRKLRITLQYCNRSVRDAFKSYLKAQSFFGGEKTKSADKDLCAMPEDGDTYYVLNRLGTLATELDALAEDPAFAAKRQGIERLAQTLRELLKRTKASRGDRWLERVQSQLAELDKELLKVARDCIPLDRMSELRGGIEAEADKAKAPCDRATLNYLLDAAVREELDVFALSLFDI